MDLLILIIIKPTLSLEYRVHIEFTAVQCHFDADLHIVPLLPGGSDKN
jgi:hypothetical protein